MSAPPSSPPQDQFQITDFFIHGDRSLSNLKNKNYIHHVALVAFSKRNRGLRNDFCRSFFWLDLKSESQGAMSGAAGNFENP
jgi:hypothetical protein